MDKLTPKTSGSHFKQGALSFGKVMEKASPSRVLTLMFKCRKKSFDYMGQIRVDKEKPGFYVEILNDNYFSYFSARKQEILNYLEILILRRLAGHETLPAEYKSLIPAFLEERVHPCPSEPEGAAGENSANGCDLQEIFDRLNTEYFNGGIQARVGWGRDSRTPNRSAIRFGSYDLAKKAIRIHPRLNQDFVPSHVVELTVHHEMCHQWAPPRRRNGMWSDHHADFKKKEKEYRFYLEARRWEKQNWKKLLKPVEKRMP
jgi:predicted SprT family Zn-dependent metalloprotease